MTASTSPTQGTPVRVLQVVGSLGLGGAETAIMNIYRSIDRDRVQFDFLVFGDHEGEYEDEVRSLGGRVLRLPLPNRRRPLAFVRAATALIRRGRYTVVHSHINFASAPVLFAARLGGAGHVVAHAHIAGSPSQALRRRLYESGARIALTITATDYIGCGQEASQYVFGSRAHSAVVIPNGVDVARFSAAEPIPRESLGVSGPGAILLSVARLDRQKNHAFLLDVMAALSAVDSHAHLVVVGRGGLRGNLDAKARDLAIADRVHFLDARRDIPELMQTADALVLPSLYEGLPVVLVESQSAGLPALVSDAVTTEADLGLDLVRFMPLSIDSWAKAIERLPTTRPRVGNQTIAAALSRRGYTAESAALRLLAVYGLNE